MWLLFNKIGRFGRKPPLRSNVSLDPLILSSIVCSEFYARARACVCVCVCVCVSCVHFIINSSCSFYNIRVVHFYGRKCVNAFSRTSPSNPTFIIDFQTADLERVRSAITGQLEALIPLFLPHSRHSFLVLIAFFLNFFSSFLYTINEIK